MVKFGLIQRRLRKIFKTFKCVSFLKIDLEMMLNFLLMFNCVKKWFSIKDRTSILLTHKSAFSCMQGIEKLLRFEN